MLMFTKTRNKNAVETIDVATTVYRKYIYLTQTIMSMKNALNGRKNLFVTQRTLTCTNCNQTYTTKFFQMVSLEYHRKKCLNMTFILPVADLRSKKYDGIRLRFVLLNNSIYAVYPKGGLVVKGTLPQNTTIMKRFLNYAKNIRTN